MVARTNKKFEEGLDGFIVQAKDMKLLGGFYRGAGKGLRPTAIFVHGVPGIEKNMDLLYRLREEGWNTLYFHYRGSWGSEGHYNLLEQGEDIQAALDWVLAQPSVDQDRLLLIGSSIGGYNTLFHGGQDKRFRYLVSLCPLIDPKEASLPNTVFANFAQILQGVTANQLKAQWAQLPPVTKVIQLLQDRNVLLITGEKDDIFPPKHYKFLGKSLKKMKWIRKSGADHQFSNCRPWLRETIISWLQTQD